MKTRTLWFLSLPLVWLLSLLVLPFIGAEMLRPHEVFGDPGSSSATLFWVLRLPRVLAGMLTGAVLALAGLAVQALFRNPLATPFTLGTASGASLGASLYIWTGWSVSVLGLSGQTLFSFLGAAAALLFIYGLAWLKDNMAAETLLLAGVAIGIFFSSLILLLQYLSDQAHSLRILRWLMGGLEVVGYRDLLQSLPLALVGLVIIMFHGFELNLLSTGEELSQARGLDVPRVKLLILSGVGLMVGSVVALAGPVAFIGLMVPHVARLLLGPDHRRLTWAVLFLGATFLPVCDVLARLILAPAELPVGIITALLGGPFFIWVLTRKKT